MKPHDPYSPLLNERCREYDLQSEKALITSLAAAKTAVRSLRSAYLRSPSEVDFSSLDTRSAYLLAYYPYYIEPLYETLKTLPIELTQTTLNRKSIHVCAFGAGPAPEVLGLLAFIHEFCPKVKNIHFSLLDKYAEFWQASQEMTRQHLAPQYWSGGKLSTQGLPFDFGLDACVQDQAVCQVMQKADLLVIQNCLSELSCEPEQVVEIILNLFCLSKPGSILIISDLMFGKARKIIQNFQKKIIENGAGLVIKPLPYNRKIIQPKIDLPTILDHLFSWQSDTLMVKNTTKFYDAVFQRTTPEPADAL